jgi:GT2 family glycosyltransferase
MSEAPITVVMITRNRGRHIHTALEHLIALPERPHIIVVDNGSSDDTLNIARTFHPSVEVVPLGKNMGGAGRNVGVALASTPYVAFSDDDSWWAAGALNLACNLFESDPRLGLVEARILVGPHQQIDPVCQVMAESPLAPDGKDGIRLSGIPITSFIACGAIVRRAAFRQIGGFHPRFGVGGEEEVLALDLLRKGWRLIYAEELTAYHYPSPIRNLARRQRHQVRNALWTAWLRRPASSAVASTWRIVSTSLRDDSRRVGLFDALLGLPWILTARHPIPASIDRQVQLAEASFYGSLAAKS